MLQRTLGRSCRLAGVGLHTGADCRVTLHPAAEDTGYRLVRTDLPGLEPIPATVDFVQSTHYATSLGGEGWRVHTVEHLLAALSGCEIDNVLIEIEGPEVPVLDGSARGFVVAIDEAGTVSQTRGRRYHRLRREVSVGEGERWARLLPADEIELAATVGFSHPRLQHQHLEVRHADFREALAPARTFGFLHELEAMRAAGLIRGGSLDNALVMGPEGWLNPEGERIPDEPVRHKLLDAVGDLALFGGRLLGRYEGMRAGHALNVALVKALRDHPDWLEVTGGGA